MLEDDVVVAMNRLGLGADEDDLAQSDVFVVSEVAEDNAPTVEEIVESISEQIVEEEVVGDEPEHMSVQPVSVEVLQDLAKGSPMRFKAISEFIKQLKAPNISHVSHIGES